MQWTLVIVVVCVLVATVEAFTGPVAAFGVRIASSSSKLYADVEITFPNNKKAKAAAGSALKDGMIFLFPKIIPSSRTSFPSFPPSPVLFSYTHVILLSPPLSLPLSFSACKKGGFSPNYGCEEGKCGSCELIVNGKSKIRPCIGKVPAAGPVVLKNP